MDESSFGILLFAFNDAATLVEATIKENTVNCKASGDQSIRAREAGLGGESGTVREVEIEANEIESACAAHSADPGTLK